MATILSKVERPCAIRQQISAGGDFDGSEPTGAPTFENEIFKFAAEATGGLLDISSSAYSFEGPGPLLLVGLEITFGGQSSWTLTKKDVDGNAIQIDSGTNEARLFKAGGAASYLPIYLLWGDKLELSTASASGAMTAIFKVAPYRP